MNNKRRKRDHLKLFEYLPNELIVEIFSYLNGVDAVFAFSQLNYCFQCLLLKYCRKFDFKSIRKRKLNYVLQHCDTKQWKSLRFSNDNNTPEQIEYFFRCYFHTKTFPQLESLSLLGMKIDNMLIHLASLRNLVSLTIKSVCGQKMSTVNLPQLKKLVVQSCRNTDWLKNFSRLKNLEFTLIYCCSNRKFLKWPLTLKRLRIIFENQEHLESIHESFRYLFQLNTLEIYEKGRGKFLPNGQIWKRLIRSSLPLLKNFRFYFQFYYNSASANRLERVVKSFSTPFYRYEKKWFNHCDLCTNDRTAHLYSLPFSYHFKEFTSILPNNVKENIKQSILRETFTKSNENFNMVINSQFYAMDWRRILTKLRHIEIKYDAIISPNEFCILLEKTPYSYSLIADASILQTLTANWTHIPICNQLSHKIRSLKLYSTTSVLWKLNRYEVNEILSSCATKCEHLSFYVQLSIETIAFILRIFRSLQSLHVLIVEEDHSKLNMKWLEQQTTKFNHFYTFTTSHDNYHCYFSL